MNQNTLLDKILNLETEVQALKQKILKEPDYSLDDINWEKVKGEVKKTRRKLYAAHYRKK